MRAFFVQLSCIVYVAAVAKQKYSPTLDDPADLQVKSITKEFRGLITKAAEKDGNTGWTYNFDRQSVDGDCVNQAFNSSATTSIEDFLWIYRSKYLDADCTYKFHFTIASGKRTSDASTDQYISLNFGNLRDAISGIDPGASIEVEGLKMADLPNGALPNFCHDHSKGTLGASAVQSATADERRKWTRMFGTGDSSLNKYDCDFEDAPLAVTQTAKTLNVFVGFLKEMDLQIKVAIVMNGRGLRVRDPTAKVNVQSSCKLLANRWSFDWTDWSRVSAEDTDKGSTCLTEMTITRTGDYTALTLPTEDGGTQLVVGWVMSWYLPDVDADTVAFADDEGDDDETSTVDETETTETPQIKNDAPVLLNHANITLKNIPEDCMKASNIHAYIYPASRLIDAVTLQEEGGTPVKIKEATVSKVGTNKKRMTLKFADDVSFSNKASRLVVILKCEATTDVSLSHTVVLHQVLNGKKDLQTQPETVPQGSAHGDSYSLLQRTLVYPLVPGIIMLAYS